MKSTVPLAMGESLSRCRIASVTILLFLHRIASQTTTQFLEDLTIYLREHHGCMYLTVTEFWKLCQGPTTILIVGGEHAEGNKHLVSMQTGVLATQIFNLRLLNWFDEALRNQFCLVVDLCQILGGIEQKGSTTT